MYIEFTYDATNYHFQKKDESGVDIGSVETYAQADYKIAELTDLTSKYLTVYPQDQQAGTFPYTAQYPRERMVSKQL